MLAQTLQHARQLLNRHNLVCTLTLWAFVASSVGLPTQPFGRPTSGCRCGDDLKAAGQCCCMKAQQSSSPKSCCAGSAQKSSVRACCEKKATCCEGGLSQPESRCSTSTKSCCRPKPRSTCPSSSGSKTPAVSACGCGGIPSDAGLLTNAEPRRLTAIAVIHAAPDGARWVLPSEPFPPCPSESPETPPPKVHRSLPSPA